MRRNGSEVHPLGGIFRRKYRCDRRPGLPREGRLLFHAREGWAMLRKHAQFAALYWRYRQTLRRVLRDARPYSDVATTAPAPGEADVLELFTATRGGHVEAERSRRRTIAIRAAGQRR
jgi:hypothetical protein